MKKPTLVFLIVFVVLAILHQDVWNWNNTNLVFGFIPAGLAYHTLYSIVVAGFWACVMKFAWPHHIEEWADREEEEGGNQ